VTYNALAHTRTHTHTHTHTHDTGASGRNAKGGRTRPRDEIEEIIFNDRRKSHSSSSSSLAAAHNSQANVNIDMERRLFMSSKVRER